MTWTTVTTASGFVVQQAVRNNQSFVDNTNDDFEPLYHDNGPRSYRVLSQYQVTTAPGDYLAPIGNTGQFKRVSAAAFEATPEPSAFALLLSGLGLLVTRRSRS